MAFAATLENPSGPDARQPRLWLAAHSAIDDVSGDDVSGIPAWVHISTASGLVVEAADIPQVGAEIEVAFSAGARVCARIMWTGASLFGCLFVGRGASAAELAPEIERTMAIDGGEANPDPRPRRGTDVTFANVQVETLGMRLRQLRAERGIMQDEVATRLGVSAASVSHWESDRSHPKLRRLADLANLFGVPAQELTSFYTATSFPKDGDERKIADMLAANKLQIAKILSVDPDHVRIMVER